MRRPRKTTVDVDSLYEAFCGGLAPGERLAARSLAQALGLSPVVVPWSAIFKHPVTLSAPALIAEGMTCISSKHVEHAVLAHLLSVIEAFGNDRIADGQVTATSSLRRLLQCLREGRDAALEHVGGPAFNGVAADADRLTRDSITRERDILSRAERVSWDCYAQVSRGKQAVGLVASAALAACAGWDESRLDAVRSTLLGVAMGLQYHDDVADWEDDFGHGGAWAVALCDAPTRDVLVDDPTALRRCVHESGVLSGMLDLARSEYERAATEARALDAHALSRWARGQAAAVAEQAEGERRGPGYVSRERRLRAWKLEVLP